VADLAVVGAGTMGAGIAESAALAGLTTVIVDTQDDVVARGLETIRKDFERRVRKGRMSEDERDEAPGRISTTTSLEACADAYLPGGAALRVIAALVNEAAFALTEGVASAEDIDRAMQLGANYPKGPLAWADELGLDRILRVLDALRALHGDPYVAAPLLRRCSALGRPISG
jgi:3-hydroxyacyl-CoA dehydrogenase